MLVKLKDISTRLSSGDSIKSSSVKENGIFPVFGGNGIRGYTDSYNFNGECVLIGRQGEQCGNIHYFKGKAFITEHAIVLCTKTDVDTRYIACLLSLIDLRRFSSQSAQPGISVDTIKNITIDILNSKSQTNVGHILSLIEQQLERNNAIVKRLQVLSQAIFNHFFSSETNLVSLLDFPYIQILKPGITKFEGEKNYVATAEVEGEKLNYNAPLIEYETRENRANMQPIVNSVWFAKLKNSIKHIYISSQDEFIIKNFIFSTGFCGIKCENIAFEYVINYLNLPYFEKEKDILSHGATMEGINNEDLKSFKIHLPTKDKLILFHNKTKEIYYEISKIRHITFQITCLKDKLQPLLINGQLK